MLQMSLNISLLLSHVGSFIISPAYALIYFNEFMNFNEIGYLKRD